MASPKSARDNPHHRVAAYIPEPTAMPSSTTGETSSTIATYPGGGLGLRPKRRAGRRAPSSHRWPRIARSTRIAARRHGSCGPGPGDRKVRRSRRSVLPRRHTRARADRGQNHRESIRADHHVEPEQPAPGEPVDQPVSRDDHPGRGRVSSPDRNIGRVTVLRICRLLHGKACLVRAGYRRQGRRPANQPGMTHQSELANLRRRAHPAELRDAARFGPCPRYPGRNTRAGQQTSAPARDLPTSSNAQASMDSPEAAPDLERGVRELGRGDR